MKPINLRYLWERHHGRLDAEARAQFVARPEAWEICSYPFADVEAAVIEHRRLDDILAKLRATSGSAGESRPSTGSPPTGRAGKSNQTGQVWSAPLPQPNAKPEVDKPGSYNG